MFDCTDPESFRNIRQWMGEIDRYQLQDVKIILVGNKYDEVDKVAVEETTAKVNC